MHTDFDAWMRAIVFVDTRLENVPDSQIGSESFSNGNENGSEDQESPSADKAGSDIHMTADGEARHEKDETIPNSASTHNQPHKETESNQNATNGETSHSQRQKPQVNGKGRAKSPNTESGPANTTQNPNLMDIDRTSPHTTRAMAARAQGGGNPNAAADDGGDDDDDDDEYEQGNIHPYFIHPPPIPQPALAQDVDPLALLLTYVSKQEEVVRLWATMLEGLLKGQRLRKTVLGWCKAEGHAGEMSDGEDWFDLEEWGIKPEELRKGKDEEETEVAAEGSGRTGRRRGGRGGAAAERG
jgi:hypothetical protein